MNATATSSDASTTVVVGAAGGIGSALVAQLVRRTDVGHVLALSRGASSDTGPRVSTSRIDVTDESSVAAAAERARLIGGVRRVIVCTGLLHRSPDIHPEKHWGALTPEAMAHLFAVNATGPALIAKHFLPLFPRDGRSVFAAISARVGSIEDNRLGGWYAYRASKAALNMLLKTFAIELARRAPQAVCIGLHPGTVDTRLSKPFQRGVAPERLFTPARSAGHLLEVLARVTPADSGCVLAWDGSRIPA